MTDAPIIKLQSSKIHLILTLAVYVISLFSAWYYAPYVWLSLLISLLLFISLHNFLPAAVLRNQPQSIVQMCIHYNHISLQQNNQVSKQYHSFSCVYHSRFLLIITLGKKQLLIFKDTTALPLSSILTQINDAQH